MKNQVIEIHDTDGWFRAIHALAESISFVGANISETAGFTLRDEIAMRVIQSLANRQDQTGMNPTFIANYAYQIADAALKARDVKPNR